MNYKEKIRIAVTVFTTSN